MYEVSWCIIGKDPEAQPFLFGTFEEASKFLQEELFWLARDAEDQEVSNAAGQAGVDIRENGNRPREFVFNIGGISYWLLKGEIVSWGKA